MLILGLLVYEFDSYGCKKQTTGKEDMQDRNNVNAGIISEFAALRDEILSISNRRLRIFTTVWAVFSLLQASARAFTAPELSFISIPFIIALWKEDIRLLVDTYRIGNYIRYFIEPKLGTQWERVRWENVGNKGGSECGTTYSNRYVISIAFAFLMSVFSLFYYELRWYNWVLVILLSGLSWLYFNRIKKIHESLGKEQEWFQSEYEDKAQKEFGIHGG